MQKFVGALVRGNSFFVQRKLHDKKLLNVGCGWHASTQFVNLDYGWHPTIDVCWDITKKDYPFKEGAFEGIYTEHCLEHIPFDSCLANLKEFHRMLSPNGVVRIVVPDGELYCKLYAQSRVDKQVRLPYSKEMDENTPIMAVNRIFRGHGHQFIYDFETMEMLLSQAGFRNIQRASFRKGIDPRLLIDRPEREVESLYVEAVK